MKQVKSWLQDALNAFKIGFLVSSVMGVILFLCGFILNHLTILSGLEVAKNGLLLMITVDLFLMAGMLMIKGKKPEELAEHNGWKKHFHLMGYKAVMGIICIAMLGVASVVDYLIVLLK